MTTCAKCGRALKDPRSIEHGYGPECWSKIKAGIKKHKSDDGNQSDYTYHVSSSHGEKVLVIEDLNLGGMSVTNNIEAIMASIADEIGEGIYSCSASPDERKVIADFKETADALWCAGKNYKEA